MLLLLFAAAPPLADPLPLGAVVRLGLARPVLHDYDRLSVTPDGR